MQNKLIIFVALPTFLNALYNPFFTQDIAPKNQQVQKVIIKEVKPTPKRKSIKMTYFGFVETNKGKFALIAFNNKNIVIRKGDSLYLDENIHKIKKITSNYIIIKDRYGRSESVYFSTAKQANSQSGSVN